MRTVNDARPASVVIDSDGHVMEPLDLWARYLPASLRARAPQYDGMIMMLDGVDVIRRDRYVGRTKSAATQFTDPKYVDAARAATTPCRSSTAWIARASTSACSTRRSGCR